MGFFRKELIYNIFLKNKEKLRVKGYLSLEKNVFIITGTNNLAIPIKNVLYIIEEVIK